MRVDSRSNQPLLDSRHGNYKKKKKKKEKKEMGERKEEKGVGWGKDMYNK